MMEWRDDKAQPAAAAATAASLGQLCLYVAGASPRAALAEANVRRCCDLHFGGRYQLTVIDLHQHPELARREQLTALPALVRLHPGPRRYLAGTLTNESQLQSSLALGEGEAAPRV